VTKERGSKNLRANGSNLTDRQTSRDLFLHLKRSREQRDESRHKKTWNRTPKRRELIGGKDAEVEKHQVGQLPGASGKRNGKGSSSAPKAAWHFGGLHRDEELERQGEGNGEIQWGERRGPKRDSGTPETLKVRGRELLTPGERRGKSVASAKERVETGGDYVAPRLTGEKVQFNRRKEAYWTRNEGVWSQRKNREGNRRSPVREKRSPRGEGKKEKRNRAWDRQRLRKKQGRR